MRTRRFTLALVAMLAALAALAACGGEDGALGNRSLGDERTNDTFPDDTDVESSDDTSPDDTDVESSDDTSPDDTAGDEPSGEGGEFCDLYNSYTEGASELLSGEASPDELQAVYQEFEEIAGPMADAAPDEINDDVNTLIEVAYMMGDVLADHDYDITEAMSDPALTDAFNQDYLDATENVDEYVSTNC